MTSRTVGYSYVEKIIEEIPLGKWFLNEEIRHIIPENQSISRSMSQLVFAGYAEKKIIKRVTQTYSIFAWRIINISPSKIPREKRTYLKSEYKPQPCALAELMGMVPIAHKLPRMAKRTCCGTGHGSSIKKSVSAWNRTSEITY